MPRDPRDTTTSATEKIQRRLGEADDQKEPIRLRVGAGPAGATGKEGPKGEDGEDGTDGATWYSGAGAPEEVLGVNGDFYLRTSNEDVYKKIGGGWNIITNIKGEKGETGATGAGGKEGPAGSAENNDWKNSVRCATTANIATATALNPGDVIDGVTLVENDRVLVKDQTTKSQNGIWLVKASPSRALDADAAAELSGGSSIYVEEGTKNKRRTFQVITPGNITPGTTAHEYQQLGFRDFGIVEALPTTEAVKNDRCSYVADKTNGVLWELRYDGEGSYPWKKVGGPPMLATSNVSRELNNQTTYVSLPTDPLSLTLPLNGDYDVEITCGLTCTSAGTPVREARVSYSFGATAAEDTWGAVSYSDSSANARILVEVVKKTRWTSKVAAEKIEEKGRTGGAYIASWSRRRLWLDPVRVG